MVPVVVGSNPIIHPNIARVAELVDALVLGTSTFWCESSSLSSRIFEDKTMKTFNYFLFVSCTLFLGCTSQDTGKLMIYKEKIICLSELKDTCVKLADQKCNNNYSVIREEYRDNYWFSDDQYIVTFVCK